MLIQQFQNSPFSKKIFKFLGDNIGWTNYDKLDELAIAETQYPIALEDLQINNGRLYRVCWAIRAIWKHQKKKLNSGVCPILGLLPQRVIPQQIHDIGHEVVLWRVLFVIYGHVEGVSKNLNHIGAVGGRHEVKWHLQVFYVLVGPLRGPRIQIYFVRYYHAGDVRAIIPHLCIPYFQVVVGDFPSCVENHYAGVGPVVITGVQLIERLLARSVPDVHRVVHSFVVCVMTVHRQSVGRGSSLFTKFQIPLIDRFSLLTNRSAGIFPPAYTREKKGWSKALKVWYLLGFAYGWVT